MKNTRRGLLIISILVAVCGLAYALFVSQHHSPSDDQELPSPIEEVVNQFDWESASEINPEFIGTLKFESNLVNQNVVQTSDNEKYLNLSWDLQESTQGAAFLDYRNFLDDQNLIIYGHYVYKDESLMFSPLHELVNEENYEMNKNIELNLENEIRRYEVAYVYYYEMDNPSMEYFHINYDADYFDLYQKTIRQKSFYNTGLSLTMDDHILTLQTCVRNRDDLRLIVVAKQIN